MTDDKNVREFLNRIYSTESRKILATLIRLLGDFEIAEDALHDAFAIAIEQWQERGIPENPRSWLISTGRFKAIDNLRRRSRYDFSLGKLANKIDVNIKIFEDQIDKEIEDDELRLNFHMLSSGFISRGTDRTYIKRSLQFNNGRNCKRIPYHAINSCAKNCTC